MGYFILNYILIVQVMEKIEGLSDGYDALFDTYGVDLMLIKLIVGLFL